MIEQRLVVVKLLDVPEGFVEPEPGHCRYEPSHLDNVLGGQLIGEVGVLAGADEPRPGSSCLVPLIARHCPRPVWEGRKRSERAPLHQLS